MPCFGVECAQCGVDGECEEKREQSVWNEDACEEEDAGGGECEECGVEACALREGAASPGVAEECEAEDSEREREMNGEGVLAEEAHARRGDPVGEWRLFEIADAVDVKCDPVAGVQHGLCGLRVSGVGVIEQ